MPEALGLRVVFLGSGSRGNAVVVTDGTTTILVDCGFTAREAARRMAQAGIAAASVGAIVVTHEHGDHVAGVADFARRHACAVRATRGTLEAANLDAIEADVDRLVPGREDRIGTLAVLPFPTSHDVADPIGVRIEAPDGTRLGLVTDTGVVTAEAFEALADVDILGLETNHDLAMLDRGPYPAFLKRRIRSAWGHLSNADAADALERLASDRLQRVFALHRSLANNTAPLAEAALGSRLVAVGLRVPVDVVPQDGPSDGAVAQLPLFPREDAAGRDRDVDLFDRGGV